MRESFAPGDLYAVSVRVELNGTLRLPPEKGEKEGKQLKVTGKSSIDYEERLLDPEAGGVQKTLRSYERMEFERKVGDVLQQNQLRPEVRRLVLLRFGQREVPFSPDGPLTWGEIDLVRTDVFTPALAGLLPEKEVRPGDRWAAATSAVQELTDFEELAEGALVCRFEEVSPLGGRPHARVSFTGSLKGSSEDGLSRQKLEGYVYFDLGERRLAYLSMLGSHELLDKDGRAVGEVSGQFVLTRRPLRFSEKLGDSQVRSLVLEPNDDNTRLLYDNPDLGLRLLHPRRWHVAGVKGRQLGLDERGGSGMLLTVEPPTRVPTGTQFARESREWLEKEKATVRRVEPVRVVQTSPRVEEFTIDAATGGQAFRMYYLIWRNDLGGVVVAARLRPGETDAAQREVLRVVRSIELTRKQ